MATTLNGLLNHGCLVAVPTPMIAGNDQEAPWVTDASPLWSAATAWSVACSVRTAHGCTHTSSMASSQMVWIRSISWPASKLPKEVAGNFVQLPWMSLPSWWSLTGTNLAAFESLDVPDRRTWHRILLRRGAMVPRHITEAKELATAVLVARWAVRDVSRGVGAHADSVLGGDRSVCARCRLVHVKHRLS